MNRNYHARLVAPVAICAMLLSVLYWGNFLKTVVSKADDIASPQPATQSTLSADDSFSLPYAAFVDSLTSKINSGWNNYAFQKRFFSGIYSMLAYRVTGELMSSQVLPGKENWLFLKSTTDGNPIADYEGTNFLTDEEMEAIWRKADMTQRTLENLGVRFAILVAPNKENVYAQYMPEMFTHSDISRTDRLVAYLKERGVNIVSPKQELLDNLDYYQLYYPYDTHWNELGAYIGVRAALASWGMEWLALSERAVTSRRIQSPDEKADLARMSNLPSAFNEPQYSYSAQGTAYVDWERYFAEEAEHQVSRFYFENAANDASILLVGDSFRHAMIPALGEAFSRVYVIHRDFYPPNLLSELNPDYCLAVYVERYSNQIGAIDFLIPNQ